MNDVENLTIQVLQDIRSELRSLKDEVSKTNERLDKTIERLDHLEQRQTATESLLAREINAVIGAIQDLKDTLVAELAVKKLVDDHEIRLALLEQRARH
jgi:DNA anti-recombination protein RmuC